MLIVKKYGGTSVSSSEKILEIAKILKNLKMQKRDLIIVVSAMGDTTDNLIELTRQITKTPIQREMDMLLSSGERISMALLAIALNSIGLEAISFTGSQSGVLTDTSHSNARIHDIKAFRVSDEIKKGKVVIIAGFQGVSPETKEVTTLGRGGSDTTAIAMAVAFNATECDILTDVDGIYSGDPRIEFLKPKLLPHLEYDVALEMTYWGARVLHYRSVELAERNNIPLIVNASSEMGPGTTIGHRRGVKMTTENEKTKKDDSKKKDSKMEQTEILAVNYNEVVACLKIKGTEELAQAMDVVGQGIKSSKLATPQFIYQRKVKNSVELFLSLPEENFESLAHAIGAKGELDSQWGTVTITGRGLVNSPTPFEASRILSENKISPEALIITPLSLTFLVKREAVKKTTQILHKEFCE